MVTTLSGGSLADTFVFDQVNGSTIHGVFFNDFEKLDGHDGADTYGMQTNN